jgi:hypothetical protein
MTPRTPRTPETGEEHRIREAHRVEHVPGDFGPRSWCAADDRAQPCDTQVLIGILDAERVREDEARALPDPAAIRKALLLALPGTDGQGRLMVDVVDGALRATSGARALPDPTEPLRRFAEDIDKVVSEAGIDGRFIAGTLADVRWVPQEAVIDALLLIPGLPCPMRSSITYQPCVLPWGHNADPDRFHRFERASR